MLVLKMRYTRLEAAPRVPQPAVINAQGVTTPITTTSMSAEPPPLVWDYETIDERETFIEVTRVDVTKPVIPQSLDGEKPPTLASWGWDQFEDYRSTNVHDRRDGNPPQVERQCGRLIEAVGIDGHTRFIVASDAWLMDGHGNTIERIA